MSLKIPGSVQNRGPCDMGFHIPTQQEFEYVVTAMARGTGHSTSYADLEQDYFTYLHFPNVGYLGRADGNRVMQYGNCRYWTCTASSSSSTYCFMINEKYTQGSITVTTDKPANAFSIRAFADSFVYPDSSWTTLLDQNDVTIAWSSSKKLISIIDLLNNKYITMQDRNVGATARWDNGDTLTDNNVGLFFQRGNNYGWPLSGPTAFTGTTVSFGSNPPTPENPYYDNHFVATSNNNWFTTSSSTPVLKIWGGHPTQAGYPLMVEPINITYKIPTGIEVWHNEQLGIYSLTQDFGNTWTTIADRDLGAFSQGYSGQLFQWGNNYGFPYNGTVTTASTTPNVTTYGPDNPYSSSTFDRNTGTSSSSYQYTSAAGINGYGYNLWGFYSSSVADRRGPCDAGSHIPITTEVNYLINCLSALGYRTADQVEEVIYLPCAGSLTYEDGQPSNQGYTMRYWTCEPNGNVYQAKIMYGGRQTSTLSPTNLGTSAGNKSSGFSIRPFYDEGIDPTEEPEGLSLGTFVPIGASGNYELWYNEAEGIFSFTTNGRTTWYSFSDKNLGATTRWGGPSIGFDFYTEETCGKYYQWGNNYGFSYNGASKISSHQVSPCNHGPGNYYSSDTFITLATSSASSQCWLAPNPIQNLWGGITDTNEAKQGPCPAGFHIPTRAEMASIRGVRDNIALTVPYYYRNYSSTGSSSSYSGYNNSGAYRRTCETGTSTSLAYGYRFYSSGSSSTRSMAYGYPIRPFKNEPVVPSAETEWVRTYQGTSTKTVNQVYQGSTQVRPPTTTKLLLNKYTASVGIGRTLNLDEILFPLASKDSVTRTSSDTNIATVSSTGTVTGVALGTCTITAETSNNLFTTCDIVVNNVPDYLCFTANTAGSTVTLNKNGTPAEVSLEISTDKSTWTAYNFNGTTGDLITLANVGDVVYFRNTSTTTTNFGLSGSNYYRFVMTGSIAASGSVNYLLNKNHTETLPCDYVFYRLFQSCGSLTSSPQLPATKLTPYCYHSMFQSCPNLTTLPILPATMLPTYCYYYMFAGCSQIKLSSTQTGDYQTPYRIPTIGTGIIGSSSLTYMFNTTGGTFTGTPSINTTYYTSNGLVY